MANIIKLKIDVKKLDKSRFFQGKEDRNGHAPLYVDLVLIPRKEVGQYGDTHMVKQDKKKGETIDLPIIGNATEKEFGGQSKPSTPPPQANQVGGTGDEDVPF
jgi:hypothetical protein